MNEKNFEYLRDTIKYHGFGETLNGELQNQLQKGNSQFNLAYKTQINKGELEATLYFKRSDARDLYFFNKYDVRAKTEKDENVSQTFYINKGHGVTLKEAFNLLNGRAVYKELLDKQDQKYQAWIQLDFRVKDKNGNYERKQFHQNYGYDLKEALSYYSIKDMLKKDDAEKLIRSLEKGNVQMVTLESKGKDMKFFIEANPQYKTLNLYNSKMQNIDWQQKQELMCKPELQNSQKEQSEEKDLSQDKSKSVKQNPDDNQALPKKKTSRKKGITV